MRAVRATRYVTPFREGGSLPGLVEADDDGLYVVKFRGAGQGPRVLVAEWLAGEIGRALGLLVPDLVAVDLEAGIADSEPDQEIHDLLVASVGRNIGLDFLPGAMTFNPVVDAAPDPDWAATVMWLDALTANPDRSPKNPNLLVWHGRPWLIDHGAGFSIHYTWRDPDGHARRSHAERLADHVLLPFASSLAAIDERLAPIVDDTLLAGLVVAIPDDWLAPDPLIGDAEAQRAAYVTYLRRRLEAPRPFVEDVDRLRAEARSR
ncbi:MAG: aminotransferase class I and II [Chloroflexi bacterium]|nr:aminotransferase class I and II [Chloroflexota bacterium]